MNRGWRDPGSAPSDYCDLLIDHSGSTVPVSEIFTRSPPP